MNYPRSWKIRPGLPQASAIAPPKSRDWYAIVNATSADVAEVLIYDEIGWGVTAQGFVRELQDVTAPRIDVRVNSPGGDVFDAVAIYEALRRHPARVDVYVDGLAASAASFIAMAGERRVMARNATVMIHDASGMCWGNAGDMRELADLLDKVSDNIASIYAERAGGTVKAWRKAMLATTWYSADEAVTAGLATEVATHQAETTHQEAYAFAAMARGLMGGTPEPLSVGSAQAEWERATARMRRNDRSNRRGQRS